jgi:hypothetical protein
MPSYLSVSIKWYAAFAFGVFRRSTPITATFRILVNLHYTQVIGSISKTTTVIPWILILTFPWPPTYPLRPITTNNARSLRITATAGTKLVRTIPSLINIYTNSSPYFKSNDYIALPDQTFVHCPIFPAAATNRLGVVPVPKWLILLSNQLNA